MRLRNAWVFIIIAASAALPLAAGEKTPLESVWTEVPVQIDGQLTEWPEESLQINKDFDVRYAFKNDANFVYCAFVFDEPRYLSSIEQSGMTFWINPEKEHRTYGFRFYRKSVTPDQLIEQMEKDGTVLTDEKKAEFKAKPRYLLFACDVLDKKGNLVPRQPGTANGTYRMARVQKRMVFEYLIPLALLTDPSLKPPLDPAKPFHLGFEWGGETEEMKTQRMAQTGGFQGGGGTGMAAGGDIMQESQREGGGGRGLTLEDGMRRIPKKYDFWIDLKLGEKK
ncbi:MAG: hypothetical protein ABSA30_00740 [Candidatus Aminicenantales bacterium]|jgi:hypothetical protein